MKKFLSLVLALVMTMSLVTIGAGATEYKDLTDKGEIKYEEAVAVLNKIGIITGYEDGSFKPTGALTRGAAAKIIVSLMIGSEAAANLTVSAAPYKDVATTNTFAAVISYCKTAGYISGYTDGTFRPTAALTGFAFSKMLLGALGYDGAVEGFTGSGWTMNVAKLGNKAGLFNNFATAFKGNDGVTREAACLLALNTLKATEVEYTGNTVSVTGKDINVAVGNNKYEYTTNLSNTDGNIPGETDVKDKLMQFAEEHFSDLKLTNGAQSDSFGRPSNQWNYKSVEIGKYAKTADYTYTTTASGDTKADKVKSMGIKDFTLGGNAATATGTVTPVINGKNGTAVTNLEQIPALLGKGTQVTLYTSDSVANRITDIVVIQTQIMQVKKVNSDNVTLKAVEGTGLSPINTVNDDDTAYATLKGLKADDFVVVTPVATSSSGTSYDVDSVYIPTTVTGNISKVSLDLTLPVSPSQVTGVTVSGTDYKLSQNWTVKDGKNNLGNSSVSSTVQSTLYLDAFGFMIYATDVTASSDYIIYDETYSNVVNGRIHYFAQGYDMSGKALSLDMGTSSSVNAGLFSGDLVKYTTQNAPDNADYKWDGANAAAAVQHAQALTGAVGTSLSAGSYFLDLNCNGTQDAGETTYASDVKFIFLTANGTWDANPLLNTYDVTGVTVKDGAQKISTGTRIANTFKDSKVKVVVVMSDADVEVSANIMYVSEITGRSQDAAGKDISTFTGYIDGTETKNLTANKIISTGFYTYAEKDGIYTMNAYSPSVGSSNYIKNVATLAQGDIAAENYITVLGGVGNVSLNAHDAQVIDLVTNDGVTYSSIKDMANAAVGTIFTVAIQYNSSTTTANSGKVAYIYITANTAPAAPVTTYTVNGSTGIKMATTIAGLSSATSGAGITADQAQNTVIYVTAATAGLAVKAATLDLTKTATAGVYSFKVGAADVAANEFAAIANGDTVLAEYAKTLAASYTYSNASVTATAVKAAVNANYSAAVFTYETVDYAITATSAFATGYTPLASGSEQTVAMNVTLTVTISGVTSTLVVPVSVTVCAL